MNQERTVTSNSHATLLTFLAGAAVGAVVVALTTPKKGSELREDLACLGRRMKGKLGDLSDQSARAWEAFKDNGQNLQAKAGAMGDRAGDAWQDVKRGASKAGTELKQGLTEAGKDLHG